MDVSSGHLVKHILKQYSDVSAYPYTGMFQRSGADTASGQEARVSTERRALRVHHDCSADCQNENKVFMSNKSGIFADLVCFLLYLGHYMVI